MRIKRIILSCIFVCIFKEKLMKSDNSFLKGTLILTVSSIVVKVIGAL